MPETFPSPHSEHLLSPEDIWKECKNLPPNTVLEKLFYFAAKDTAGNIIPLLIQVKTGPDTARENSPLVFTFKIDAEEIFSARVAYRDWDSPEGVAIEGSYTYAQLRSTLERLAGAQGAAKTLGFVEIAPEAPPAPVQAPIEHQEVRRRPPFETNRQRLERLRSAAIRSYIPLIENVRGASGFETRVHGILTRYNEQNRLLSTILSLQEGAPREFRGDPPIELRITKTLPPEARPATIEEAVQMTVKTLTVRILHGTHSTSDRDAIVSLHSSEVDALAVFREELLNLSRQHSLLHETLKTAGIKRVNLEFVANVRYSRREHEYRIVPITDVSVPN